MGKSDRCFNLLGPRQLALVTFRLQDVKSIHLLHATRIAIYIIKLSLPGLTIGELRLVSEFVEPGLGST